MYIELSVKKDLYIILSFCAVLCLLLLLIHVSRARRNCVYPIDNRNVYVYVIYRAGNDISYR